MVHLPSPGTTEGPTATATPDAQPVVLVLDYPGHRPEAKLSELRLENAGFDVRYLLTRPLPRDVTTETYARHALNAAGDVSSGVHAVLAYCMSASLARHIAALASATHLLLFDAERSTAETIAGEVLTILRSFDGDAELPGWWNEDDLARHPDAVMERIDAHLFEVIHAALAQDAGDESPDAAEDPAVSQVARSLTDTYVDWFAHLLAAYDARSPAPSGPFPLAGAAVHIMSAGHTLPDDWPGIASLARHTVDTDRNGFAAAEETQGLTLRILRPISPEI
ncbi:hypothetical protein OHA57_39005 (plasmid) [Streptomyces anulatus]|uniref:hypothetical protein n=1 Tax=Streptomyces anulatus TaxID=1892 RepID=UPI002DD8C676|nr:hypothetical protein [Streptomyces anulatus]WSC66764.1 hypothetical protein OHA57_39005 [Streptomyces anulatus]